MLHGGNAGGSRWVQKLFDALNVRYIGQARPSWHQQATRVVSLAVLVAACALTRSNPTRTKYSGSSRSSKSSCWMARQGWKKVFPKPARSRSCSISISLALHWWRRDDSSSNGSSSRKVALNSYPRVPADTERMLLQVYRQLQLRMRSKPTTAKALAAAITTTTPTSLRHVMKDA